MVVGVTGVELGFFGIVVVVIGTPSKVFGEAPAIETVLEAFTTTTIIEITATSIVEAKIAAVKIAVGILAFEFTVILPIDPSLVDVVAEANQRKLFFGVEAVEVAPRRPAFLIAQCPGYFAKSAFFVFGF